jgi:LysM repeat protein
MDFNTQKECICLCESGYRGRSEHAVDMDITLPEYLPDIVRILRCSCVPGVKSYQVNGDRITAECTCLVKALYINEQGRLYCYEQNIQFAKQIEVNGEDNCRDYFVGAKSDYMNYRVSGQRRFELHGAVTIFAKSNTKKTCEMVTDATGDGITLKCEKSEVSNLKSVVEKFFTVTETCDAGALSEPMGTIVSASASGIIHELKIVSDKLFLKGELIIHTAFTGSETGEIQCLENVININQIIEASDINETCRIDAHLTVSDLEIKPRFDLSGNKNLLDISACMSFSACGFENMTTNCIKDAYSVKYETDVKKSVIYTSLIEEEINDIFLCRGVADLSSTGVSRVHSFMCTDLTSGFSVFDSNYTISGEIMTEIIYEDIKGEICFAQRAIPYEYTRSAPETDRALTCTPHCDILARSYVINGDGQLDVRIEIKASGFIFSEKENLIITDLIVNKDKIKKTDTATLTVYFADSGEALWDIAERYNTTVDRILRENKITDTCVKEKCKLLIPKM